MRNDEQVPIYAKLVFAGMGGDGEICIHLEKDTEDTLIGYVILEMLKKFQGKDVCIIISELLQEGPE
jgi:hypothetical protein